MATVPTGEGAEALEWLRQEPPPLGVWIHKELQPVAVALALVETLYALGARRVVVPAWAVSEYDGGPGAARLTARGFVVMLPKGGPDREALIWFCASECGRPSWGPMVPLEALRSRVGCETVELVWA
jgi:hypothetical protein